MPFSIDAALSGTVSSYKAEPAQASNVPTLEESIPNGWMFDIHEDTPEEETGNVMSFSFQTVDISDDENRRASNDDRGKENIPPTDYPSLGAAAQPVTTARPVSRRDMMTDEPRTPLGDLDAADFYADGCDASSYYIVPAERSDDKTEKPKQFLAEESLRVAAPSGAVRMPNSQDGWKDLLAQIDATPKANVAAPMEGPAVSLEERSANIEIWESESAKGDDEDTPEHTFQTPLGNTVAGSLDVESLYDGNEASDDLSIF